MGSTGEEAIRRIVILVALYAIPAVVIMRPVGDNDIWMNLRAGQWIVEHRAVPTTDPFTDYGRGRPWYAYNWLFEVLVHGLYRGFGLAGIVAYRVVLSLAVMVALHRLVARREPRFVVATGLVGLAFFALAPLLNERTWLFTLLFTTLTLDVILDLLAGRATRAVWLLPAVFALWANLHIQFIYGLFLLALACGAPLVDRLRGCEAASGHADTAGTGAWWRLVALAGACLAATLLNPYHARLYGVVLEYASKSGTYDLVVELLSPAFRMPWEWVMPALVGAAAFALGRRQHVSAFDAALLAVAALLALRARRDVWFAVLAAVSILARAGRPDVPSGDRFAITRGRAAAIAGAVLVVLAGTARVRDLSAKHLERDVAEVFPAKAAAVVAERGYPGPLFNEYGWGSYLLWRLPALSVSIDGRAELHGPDRIKRNVETMSGLKEWDYDPDLLTARTVIIDAKSALASILRLDPRFELAHEDKLAAVFLARPPIVEEQDQ